MPFPIKQWGRRLKRWAREIRGADPKLRRTIKLPVEHFGSDYGGWWLCTEKLPPNPIVYSIGVGQDISFDLALTAVTNATIYAYDPTPKAIEWIRTQTLPKSMTFHPVALSNTDGTLTFHMPDNPDHISHTTLASVYRTTPSIEVPCKQLKTLMAENGHTHIDVLKMDIEGSEYDVIDNVLASNLSISQLLVEFHHNQLKLGKTRTETAVRQLEAAGYHLYFVSPSGDEASFIHSSIMQNIT